MQTHSGRPAAARPALIMMALGVLVAASMLDGGSGQSLAQEGAATPATPVLATPLAIDFTQPVAERPAAIMSGSCDDPGEVIAPLTALEHPEGEAQGQGAAIEAARSYTSLPIDLTSLLEGGASVNILFSDEEPETVIACGEIGGTQGESGSIVIKLSPRNGSGYSGIAFLLPGDDGTTGISVFVAGEQTVADTHEVAAVASPGPGLIPLEPAEATAVPTPTAEPVQVVDVALLEWLIDMPAEIRAGQINFAITNEGTEAHSFTIESGGVVVAELDQPIDPGDSTVLSVTLAEGEYDVYCPLGDGEHREKGMETTLTVTP
ncbi:MAG TPA: hypothetical protein VFI12_03530 [Thermomicrobiales bacterium]|nr:hypothetical protein [Thermomicrobiales bacterium]